MKVGLVGYAKPEIESALQAYAVKQYLKEYNVDCEYSIGWKIDHDDEGKSLKEFFKENIGKCKKEEINTFLMINYKAMVDMTGSDAMFRDYYQRSFETKEVITEALFLLPPSDYENITKPNPTKDDYLFLDCMSDRSPLVPLAKKVAKLHKLTIVANFDDTKYNRVPTTKIHDPKEYLGIVKAAKFVMTDSFMTLWFTVLNQLSFIAQDCPALKGKNKRFLKRLDLMEHYLGKEELRADADYTMKDNKKLEQTLHKLKTDASNYLFECLPPVVKDTKVEAPPKIMHSECCGCFACKEICTESAITMVQDSEGFYYPQVNDNCNNCNLCVKACIKLENPQTVTFDQSFPTAYAAMNVNDEQRKNSTSGGVFPLVAQHAIQERKGVVFGVTFDQEMNAVPTMATTVEETIPFSGFKYVKSELEGVYPKVKEQLENNKYVVYSGLPCECAGLKAYLNKEYENLFLIDRLCHSAPSPKLFKKYVEYIGTKYDAKVTNVRFRDKSRGWLLHKASMVFEFDHRKPLVVNARRNNYFRNYLKDNISMPGCAKCSFTVRNRVGDITLGDFWGIEKMDKEMFDNNGTSLILVNTQKGAKMLELISSNLRMKPMSLGKAFRYNTRNPMSITKERSKIFERLESESIDNLLESYNDLK